MNSQQYRFFIDSADPDLWRLCRKEGWPYGVTTNPLILQRNALPVTLDTAEYLVSAARKIGFAELQIQSWGAETDQLIENGTAIAQLWENITVKIPATKNGFAAANALKLKGICVTLTACYTAHQTALAAAMKLDYVAPYYGRMLEAGIDGDIRLGAMQKVCLRHPDLRILVASIRSITQLETLLANGFNTFTLSPELCSQIGSDEHSALASAEFENAASLSVEPQIS